MADISKWIIQDFVLWKKKEKDPITKLWRSGDWITRGTKFRGYVRATPLEVVLFCINETKTSGVATRILDKFDNVMVTFKFNPPDKVHKKYEDPDFRRAVVSEMIRGE
jgi:hypothetical protein